MLRQIPWRNPEKFRRAADRLPRAANGVVLLTVLGLLGTFLPSCRRDTAQDAPEQGDVVEEMIEALGEQRWVEPRLSASDVYNPCLAKCPSEKLLCEPRCTVSEESATVRHNRAAPVSLGWETENERGREKHAEALLTLVARHEPLTSRRKEAAERAVTMLTELAAQYPSDAKIRSDLGAAFFVRAQRSDRPQDLLFALESIEETVRMHPEAVAARFNQALVYDLLGQRQLAEQAWKLFLILESQASAVPGVTSPTGWAGLAEARLDKIHAARRSWPRMLEVLTEAAHRQDIAQVEEIVDHFRSTARVHTEEVLLPGWADAVVASDAEEAESRLLVARQISRSLAKLGSDTLLAESVDVIDAASLSHLRALVDGHQAYGQAVRYLASIDIANASEAFQRSERDLSRAQSPFKDRARVGLATCYHHRYDYSEALRILKSIRQNISNDVEIRQRRASLQGLISSFIALSHSALARPLEVLDSYEQALKWFETAEERENVINVHARLADLFRFMGAKEEAWRHRYQALQGLHILSEPRQQSFILIDSATAVLELGLTESALRLQGEVLRIARESRDDVLLTVILPQHAENNLRANRREQAIRELEEAAELSGIAEIPEVRQAVQARIREVESDRWQEEDSLRAAEGLTEAIRLLPAGSYFQYRARLLLKRARAYWAAGLSNKAAADLVQSTLTLEDEWEEVLDRRRRGENEGLWPAYFAHRRETFGLLIGLLAEQERDALALGYAERARARELLDLTADSTSEPLRPLTLEAIQSELPEGRVLVQYVQLADKLLTWVVRRERFKLHSKQVEKERIDELVEKVRAFANRDAQIDVNDALKDLYDILLRPFITEVEPTEELVFVPDGSLEGLPFAALRDSQTDRFLIQDQVLSVAPSATFYLHSVRRSRELSSPGENRGRTKTGESRILRALLVGNPRFDRELFQELEDLPEAVIETQQIAVYYPDHVSLLNDQATKARFLAELGKHEIVHFAGHAIPHPRFLFQSSLVLAPSENEQGVLYARDLLAHDLGITRLFVFSACSTVGGEAIGSLTVSGLVRPVLGAGVPAVIGTLWSVKSEAAPQLLTAFHRHLVEGANAAQALRQAQLEMLGGNLAQRSIKSWAPFQVIGVASFHDFEQRSLP